MAIYFIQAGEGGPIKIGFSVDPVARLSKMQSDNAAPCRLLGVMPGGEPEEGALHSKLAQHRIRGEWFAASADVLAQVPKAVVEADPHPITLPMFACKRGNVSALSRAVGVSHSTVLRWCEGRVPAERVRAVAAHTGIPPHELRPDLFEAPASDAAA
jgi:hypothetical protein